MLLDLKNGTVRDLPISACFKGMQVDRIELNNVDVAAICALTDVDCHHFFKRLSMAMVRRDDEPTNTGENDDTEKRQA